MKVAIIGAGNMGGAMAGGIISRCADDIDVFVSARSETHLSGLQAEYPALHTTTDNVAAAADASLVVLAVKPWILPGVIEQIKPVLDYKRQAVVSVAGGVGLDDLETMLVKADGSLPAIFHIIPDTAIAVCRSMTFVAHRRASDELVGRVVDIFDSLGEVAVVEPRLMGAATALSSCGIAYVYKYMQAAVQAGVQLGFYPADALRYVVATVDGAVAMMQRPGATPQSEIDRVTTPGGMTIRGINELDHDGFSSAVINAILKPLQK